MCYHAEFGSSALKDVGINTQEPQILGSAGTLLCWGWEAWLTLRYTQLPDTCYHVKIGSSVSKGVCINRREPPNWGELGSHPLQ